MAKLTLKQKSALQLALENAFRSTDLLWIKNMDEFINNIDSMSQHGNKHRIIIMAEMSGSGYSIAVVTNIYLEDWKVVRVTHSAADP